MNVDWYMQSTETGCDLCVRRTVSRKHTPRKSVLVCVCVFKHENLPGFQVFLENFTMFMECLFFIAATNLIRGGCELLFIKFLLDSQRHTFSFDLFPPDSEWSFFRQFF